MYNSYIQQVTLSQHTRHINIVVLANRLQKDVYWSI